jgi:hypothetical protein
MRSSAGIAPAAIAPEAVPNGFEIIGTASTGGPWRDYVPAKHIPANQNQIAVNPRDGYLTLDSTTHEYGGANKGDSGGPTMGYTLFSWPYGDPTYVNHVVTATTNEVNNSPLGYNYDILPTPNQQFTARLSSLWVKARMDDADGDGLPGACDSNPAAVSTTNLCPAPIGGPSGTAVTAVPEAKLACRLGFLPVGIIGRSGALIDFLTVKCSPIPCILNGIGCANNYNTDPFGGNGGVPWESTCAADSVLVGFKGTHDSGYIRSLGGRCSRLSSLRTGSATVVDLGVYGDTGTGSSYAFTCGTGNALTGVQARSSDKRWVTGLQSICGSVRSYSNYVGGGGSAGFGSFSCPSGTIAVGTIVNEDTSMPGAVNMFGLICADRTAVAASQNPSTIANRQVIHTSYYWSAYSTVFPAALETWATVHIPSGNQAITYCPAGYAIRNISTWSSPYLNRVNSIRCLKLSNTQTSTVTVGIGGATGTQSWIDCQNTEIVDGMVFRSGSLTDGVMLKCRPKASTN